LFFVLFVLFLCVVKVQCVLWCVCGDERPAKRRN